MTDVIRPIAAALAAAALLLFAACSAPSETETEPTPTPSPTTQTYSTAQQIVDDLRAEGFDASEPKPAEPGYVEDVGGNSWDLKIGEGKGRGDGINIFPNPQALGVWVELSKSFGGVAVTGDVWAVTLETDGGYRADSLELAPKVADALGGEVQK